MPSTKFVEQCLQAEKIQKAWKPDVGHKVWCKTKQGIYTIGSRVFCCDSILGEGFKQNHSVILQLWQLYDLVYELCGMGWTVADEECLKFFFSVMKAVNAKSVSQNVVPDISKEEAMLLVIMLNAFELTWDNKKMEWVGKSSILTVH